MRSERNPFAAAAEMVVPGSGNGFASGMKVRMRNCKPFPNVLGLGGIRPLGVRPLVYPERVPKPWGFFIARFPVEGGRQ